LASLFNFFSQRQIEIKPQANNVKQQMIFSQQQQQPPFQQYGTPASNAWGGAAPQQQPWNGPGGNAMPTAQWAGGYPATAMGGPAAAAPNQPWGNFK
jgi:hypothetical protein